MTEKGEGQKQEATFRKYDIAQAIVRAVEVKNESREYFKKRHPSLGYLVGQVSKACEELAEEFPQKYAGISGKLEHSESETRAILDRLLVEASASGRRGNNLRTILFDEELVRGVMGDLFPQSIQPPKG